MGWVIAIIFFAAVLPPAAVVVMILYFATIVWLNWEGTRWKK